MLGPMLGASGGPPAAGTALLAVAGNPAEAAAAVRAGAALVELPAAGPAAIAAFRASHPGVLVCAECDQADVVRDPATALRTGAILRCDGLPAADGAGVPRPRLLVEVPPAMVARAIAAGYAALVDLADSPAQPPDPGLAAGPIAIAAICAWLGAAVVRTSAPGQVRQVRRALDMAESIRGTRPPARAVRGLA
jgi:dihydropteroate synthase